MKNRACQMNTAGSPARTHAAMFDAFNLAGEVVHLFRVECDRELRSTASGLTTVDATILLELDMHPAPSQAYLAKAVGTTQTTIVRLLDRLERRGWVQRNSVSTDRRRRSISLTPAGKETIPKIHAGRRRVLDRINSYCGNIEPQVIETLSRLKDSLNSSPCPRHSF